jgi:hypothetical protein
MPLPKSFTDPKALSEKIEEYFERCESSKKVYELKNGDIKIRQEFPTMSGLAVHLGVTRETIYSYLNGEPKSGNSEEVTKLISDTLSYARQRVATYLSQCSLSGDADAKIASMLLTAMGETTQENNTTVNVIIQGDSEAYSV